MRLRYRSKRGDGGAGRPEPSTVRFLHLENCVTKGLNRDVAPGQVWADNDPRQAGRTIQISDVIGVYAYGKVITDCEGVTRSSVGKEVRIRLDRFWPTSRGYVLNA